jgi:flagellar biosynthetic protein FliR
MTINLLDYFLVTQLGGLLLIFIRVGSALMVLPGFGEMYVPPRVRLLLAGTFSLLLLPMLEPRMPLLPGTPLALFVMLLGEILVGVFMGLVARAILMVVHVAGTVIAQQSSLAAASIFDPTSGSQSAVVSNFLSLGAITLFFTMNLHHLVLVALVQSYDVFDPGRFPSTQDMNILYLRLVSDAFKLGIALAAPHIVFSLLFYLAGGLMMRLMPNFQVFFVMMSPQILIAFFLLMALLPTILGIYAHFMEEQYMNFVATS